MLHGTRTVQVVAVFTVLLPFGARGLAQDLNSLPPSSQEQWKVFVDEMSSPLLPGATFFNATTSELTRSVPHYGGESISYVKRLPLRRLTIPHRTFSAITSWPHCSAKIRDTGA